MNPIYEAHQLSKQYRQIQALDNLDLTLMPGRLVGLLGPNGSGKTTLIKLANGLLNPTDGHIMINGLAPGTESKKIVSYLPDRRVGRCGVWPTPADFQISVPLRGVAAPALSHRCPVPSPGGRKHGFPCEA